LTTHTFTAAPLFSVAVFSSFKSARESSTTAVSAEEEPSNTKTTSLLRFSSALGSESVTYHSDFFEEKYKDHKKCRL